MIQTEKLGAACFLENMNLFSDPKKDPEKYNLYSGLSALAETVEKVFHHVRKLEKQLNEANRKLDALSLLLPPKNRI